MILELFSRHSGHADTPPEGSPPEPVAAEKQMEGTPADTESRTPEYVADDLEESIITKIDTGMQLWHQGDFFGALGQWREVTEEVERLEAKKVLFKTLREHIDSVIDTIIQTRAKDGVDLSKDPQYFFLRSIMDQIARSTGSSRRDLLFVERAFSQELPEYPSFTTATYFELASRILEKAIKDNWTPIPRANSTT